MQFQNILPGSNIRDERGEKGKFWLEETTLEMSSSIQTQNRVKTSWTVSRDQWGKSLFFTRILMAEWKIIYRDNGSKLRNLANLSQCFKILRESKTSYIQTNLCQDILVSSFWKNKAKWDIIESRQKWGFIYTRKIIQTVPFSSQTTGTWPVARFSSA